MERQSLSNQLARFLLATAFLCLAIALIAALMPRGGTADDVAVHFAGPGSFPIIPLHTPEQATTRK
jgi:hypothetical protein